MCNLFFFFNQVKTFRKDWVVLVLILPSLHEDFDHILDPVADRSFVKYSTESLKDSRIGLWRVLSEEGAYFAHEADSNFNRVIGGPLKKKNQDLESYDFMSDGLINKMSDKSCC